MGSLWARLQSPADLPGRHSNRPARAGKLFIRLFGEDGLKLLALDYRGQLTVMDSIFKRIAPAGWGTVSRVEG